MHKTLKVSQEYLDNAEELRIINKKISAGDYKNQDLDPIVKKILKSHEKDIDSLWANNPEMDSMGFKFEYGDVFLGKNNSDVFEQAKQKYGDNKDSSLDFIIHRPGKPAILI